jgi:UMF1 family MFS transporter
MSSRTIVLMLLGCMALIPLYGLLGFVVDAIGIKSKGEMYAVSVVYGILLAALQSFSRVVFTEMIPAGMESEFFAIYEITDKGSCALGPTLVGVLADAYGIRYGFFVLTILLFLGAGILSRVDTAKGKQEARDFLESK